MFLLVVRDRDARTTLILNEYPESDHDQWLNDYAAATLKYRDSPSVEVHGFVGGTKEEFLKDFPNYE